MTARSIRAQHRMALPWAGVWLGALLLLGALLYAQQAFQFFLHDDEGSYAYAAWRISLGEVPYRDFLTPQMPAFLYWGGLVVGLCGRSFVALRLSALAMTLLAACLFYAANRALFGRRLALLALGLLLIQPDVFHNARFFRPEAMLLLFQMAGIYLFILAEQRGRTLLYAAAGSAFALAILSKLFGALPLAGCGLYLLYAGWRERRPLRRLLQQALALGLPVLLLLGAVTLVFMRLSPYFLTAVLEHHTMQGAGMPLAARMGKALAFYRVYITTQPLMLVLALLGLWLLIRRRRVLSTIWLWQIPTALVFLVLSRSLQLRHVAYLAPVVALLAAQPLERLLARAASGRWRWATLALTLGVTLAAAQPWIQRNVADVPPPEEDSAQISALIRSLAAPGERVMADYPGLNFLAGNPTTYWAAGISNGAALSGQVSGAALIGELEQQDVSLVVINALGDDYQMAAMLDYADFRRYVQTHYSLVARYDCAYRPKHFELYARNDSMPLQPGLHYRGELALTGARLTRGEDDALTVETRWRALQPIGRPYGLSLRLMDAAGHTWAEGRYALEEETPHWEPGTNPTGVERRPANTWTPGQVVWQKHTLTLPSAMPAGSYQLVAALVDPETGHLLSLQGQGSPALTHVRVPAPALPPALEALPIAVPLEQALVPELTLHGLGARPAAVYPGSELPLSLYWQATAPPAQEYRLSLSLQQGADVEASWTVELGEELPVRSWRAGEVVLGNYYLPLAGDLAPGAYDLQAQLVDAAGRAAGGAVKLGEVQVQAPLGVAALQPPIQQPLEDMTFGDGIALLGYSLSQEALAPGQNLGLTLYWECRQPIPADYVVFVHLLDEQSQIRGQRDAGPGDWSAPTGSWVPGQALADHYEVPLQPEAPAGPLAVAVGLYDPITGARLPLLRSGQETGEDRLILPVTVTVH